jgi:outer membrane PBP1 activator LpoA protein
MIAGQARHFRLIVYLLTTLWLAACGVATVDHGGSAAEREARRAYASGSYALAAESWQRIAADPASDDESRARLYAADAWILAGRYDRALEQMGQVNRRDLARYEATLYDLLQAEFSLRNGDSEAAAYYLETAHRNLPASLQDRYNTLNQRTLSLQTGPASQQLARAFSRIRDMPFYQPEQALDILRLLENVPSGHLRILTSDNQAKTLNEAWLAFALLLRESLFHGEQLESSLYGWATNYPRIPFSIENALDLSLRYRSSFRPPTNVAVLLPAQGSLTAAGNAIRDGILSAYMEQPGSTQLAFYDAGSGPPEMVSAYFQALEDGANWVVGPLRKESVDQLASLPVFSTPALVLNQPGTIVANGQVQGLPFNSMSLSQDAEAARIAEKCLELGLSRALVLVPDNSWGERMRRAFGIAYKEGEGEIIATATFRTVENDHSDLLKQLLKIDQSIERDRKLRAILGIPLEFEPSRRDDFDVIFLAATPAQGRQIKPQLKFFDAGSKPVFAPARIFSGTADPTANQDLNGILFPLTRWQLDVASSGTLPDLDSIRNGQLGALHAIGLDAWNVLPWLEIMRKDPDFVFPGAAGNLRVGRNGQLLREPVWAEFRKGRPVDAIWPAKL